jgi:hypothetical protein
MQWIRTVGYYLGKQVIKKQSQRLKREVKAFSLETAKTVAVIFESDTPEKLEEGRKFMAYLQKRGIRTEVLAFVENEVSALHFTPEKNFCYLTREEINWMGIPFGPNVDDFLSPAFDILINLCLEDSLPIQYLVTLSPARYKVGLFRTNEERYDLMINLPEPADASQLAREVVHFLNMLTPSENKEQDQS